MISLTSLPSDPKTLVSTPGTPLTSTSISPWLTPLMYWLGRHVVLPVYFKQIEVTGREHLPQSGPVLLAPTHRSRWDALMIPYAAGRDITGRDLRFLVSEDEMHGLQGWFIRRFGGFPVDPKRPTIASLRYGVELLQARETLVIFPEGNIFRDRQIQPLKPGLARLAIQAEVGRPRLGVKIVPMAIDYSQSVPQWGCDVRIQIGSPLEVKHYTAEPAKQAAKQLTTDLEAALKKLASCKISNSPIESSTNLSL